MRAQLLTDLADGGWPQDKVACVADNLIEALTAERFVELDQQLQDRPSKVAVAEVERATVQAARICGAD